MSVTPFDPVSFFSPGGILAVAITVFIAWLKNRDKNNELKEKEKTAEDAKAEATKSTLEKKEMAATFDPTKTKTLPISVVDVVSEASWQMGEDTLLKLKQRAYPYGEMVAQQVANAQAQRKILYRIETPVMWADINAGLVANWGHLMLQSHLDAMTTNLTAVQKDEVRRQIVDAQKNDLDEYHVTWPDGTVKIVINGHFIGDLGKYAPADASIGNRGEKVIPTIGDLPQAVK
ncbi:MAG: hypothetical protein WC683_05110 [bacterium]